MQKQTTKLDALQTSVDSLSTYYTNIKTEVMQDNEKTSQTMQEKLQRKAEYVAAIKEL
jgi:inosine/xanthosine triphosphate pyrophosphatase family protein